MKIFFGMPLLGAVMLCMTTTTLYAQTDADGIMMGKNLFCAGVMTSYGTWNQYWEGTKLRSNPNLGEIRTLMVGPMGSLGVSKHFNLIFSLPYVKTKATAGQLKGMQGMQDFTLIGKYRVLKVKKQNSTFSAFAIGGFSLPTHNYVKDLLPLSIGLGTQNLILRGMLDYEYKHWFATASSSIILRSNVLLDRTAYYTTRMIYSNDVNMPHVLYNNFRIGYRNSEMVAELVADQMLTQGGFDMTINNMPFPSNRMEQTRVGFNGKYEPKRWKGVSLMSSVYRTVSGRNMGKSTQFQFGFLYIFKLAKKAANKTN